MNAERKPFEDDLNQKIIGVFYQVHNELGSGFAELVYARSMAIALEQIGLFVATEVQVPVSFRGQLVGIFRADLVVERRVILEFKVAEEISRAHEAPLLHYLRASTVEVGLILNFGRSATVRRCEFRNDRKRSLVASASSPF